MIVLCGKEKTPRLLAAPLSHIASFLLIPEDPHPAQLRRSGEEEDGGAQPFLLLVQLDGVLDHQRLVATFHRTAVENFDIPFRIHGAFRPRSECFAEGVGNAKAVSDLNPRVALHLPRITGAVLLLGHRYRQRQHKSHQKGGKKSLHLSLPN